MISFAILLRRKFVDLPYQLVFVPNFSCLIFPLTRHSISLETKPFTHLVIAGADE